MVRMTSIMMRLVANIPPVSEERAIASASPRRPLQPLISPLNTHTTPVWQTAPPAAKRPRLDPPPRLPPGIPNLGNTCYLNSILQALFNCPTFCNALRNACHTLPALAPDGIAHTLLACVLHHAAMRDAPIDPRPLRRALDAVTPQQFAPGLQHDAHELFCALTDALQKEIVHAECQTRTTVVEQHTHLSLEPMQPQRGWSVQGLVGAWFKQRASVFKTCEHCGGGSVAHRMQRRLRRLPRVLVVHINRFRMAPTGEGRWAYTKALDAIQIQQHLRLAEHIAPSTWVPPPQPRPTTPRPATDAFQHPRSPGVQLDDVPRFSLDQHTPPQQPTSPCVPPAIPSPAQRPRPTSWSQPEAMSGAEEGARGPCMDAIEAQDLQAALLASMQSLPPTWAAASPAAHASGTATPAPPSHTPAAPPQPQQVVLLQEPKADASPAPTDAARRALFSLSSMVLHWGPAPSGGHYTCATRVHGAVPWCLMNDAQVTRLAEGQVAGEAHARNAYVLMYALDDAGDTILE